MMKAWFGDGGFRVSAMVAVLAVTIGFAVQYMTGTGVPVFHWPYNALFVAVFAALLLVSGVLFRNNTFVLWIGGIPFGLSLIFAIAFLSLIGGVIPQDGQV
ncbi:MAG: cytochrome c biogenesis protein, partial [Chlorobi bacterium]|nr:cytochrome c biogenesis protein [Chlorobiota bacterium]